MDVNIGVNLDVTVLEDHARVKEISDAAAGMEQYVMQSQQNPGNVILEIACLVNKVTNFGLALLQRTSNSFASHAGKIAAHDSTLSDIRVAQTGLKTAVEQVDGRVAAEKASIAASLLSFEGRASVLEGTVNSRLKALEDEASQHAGVVQQVKDAGEAYNNLNAQVTTALTELGSRTTQLNIQDQVIKDAVSKAKKSRVTFNS